jgi:hypothetical protein
MERGHFAIVKGYDLAGWHLNVIEVIWPCHRPKNKAIFSN